MSVRRLVITVYLLGITAALAQAPAPGAPPGPAPRPAEVAAETPIGSGPHRAVMETEASLPDHVLYRPANLAEAGKLPVLVWGNGACADSGNAFRWFLSDIASYGYLAIATGVITPPRAGFGTSYAPAPPASAASVTAGAANLPPPATKTAQLIEAIDWAIAENKRPGSKYFGRLDTSHIAVAGQSCGGVQAIEASGDPRIATTIVMNSGLLPGETTMTGTKLTKDILTKYHGPVAYISGDDEDIAFTNAEDDFDRLRGTPAFRAYLRGMLHGGTYNDRNGGEFAGVALAWLNWQLKGDRKSGAMFTGAQCGLCVNPRWVVRKKGIP